MIEETMQEDKELIPNSEDTFLELKGFIKWIVHPHNGYYKNDEFPCFTVFDIEVENDKTSKKDIVRCLGEVALPFFAGNPIILYGNWQFDKNHKEVFNFVNIKLDDTSESPGAKAYLQTIFGKKTAIKIIEVFDDNPHKTLESMQNGSPNEWDSYFTGPILDAKIKGITFKKIVKGYEKREKYLAIENIFTKYESYGINLNLAKKIFDKFGLNSQTIIEEHPYELIKIQGVSFKTCDNIALNACGLSFWNPERVEAGILEELKQNSRSGNVFEFYFDLVPEVAKKIDVDISNVELALVHLIKKEEIIKVEYKSEIILYLPWNYRREKVLSNVVLKHLKPTEYKKESVLKSIHDFEKENKFTLADKQKEAVLTSLLNKFSIITGPPGSGKTTIISCIQDCLFNENPEIRIAMAAPTAKAAQKMVLSTGTMASTIHTLLEVDAVTGMFKHNEHNPLDIDVLIVDEFSMVSLELGSFLFQCINNDTMIIIVGDENQLPSIDCGQVLHDFLEVKEIPKVRLNEIYRQGKTSKILSTALAIANNTIVDLSPSSDFVFENISNIKELSDRVVEEYVKAVKRDGKENTILLTPQNKTEIGVNVLNKKIQEIVNPLYKLPLRDQYEARSGSNKFRVGDLVIQTENKKEREVYNGMVGVIKEIIEPDKDSNIQEKIRVAYPGYHEWKEYTKDMYDEINLAYCLTIHKSQGSEYKNVIMVCHSEHRGMLKKDLIYTGITRAKEKLLILGETNAFYQGIRKSSVNQRLSRLPDLIVSEK